MSYGIDENIWAELLAQEKIENLYNISLAEAAGISKEDYEILTEYCSITGKIEIVDSPKGNDQEELYDTIQQVFVDQRAIGMEGDSWEGHIYAKFGKDKWLKIPYAM